MIPRGADLSGVHAHSQWHSAASHALAGGMGLVAVGDLLGRSSVIITSRYLHATGSAIGSVVTV